MDSLDRMLEVFHDVTSPASWVAVARLQRLADDGVPVRFIGVDLSGIDTTLPVTLDQLAELERVRPQAERLGVPMNKPRLRPPTIGVHLIAGHAEARDLGAAWRLAVYRAYWSDGMDLGDHHVVVGLADRCGLDPVTSGQLLRDRPAMAALRREHHSLRSEGIGGVPVVRASGTLVPATLPDDDLRHLATLTT